MHWLHEMITKLVELIGHWGYGGVFVLMTLESTFVPVPSELVIPPAAYLSALPDHPHHMNLFAVILMGTLGSIAGASFNYVLAQWVGRPFIMKYGKFILLPPHKFEKMEKFFIKHGEFGTFTGRLILGVRHFISFPAGLAKMHFGKFVFYTGVGSAIWCTVLAVIGYGIGRASRNMTPEQLNELFTKQGKMAAYIAAAVCFVLIAGYVAWQKRKKSGPAA